MLLIAVCFPSLLSAQRIYTYVGRIGPDSFLLAWGTAEGGGNTIGRASTPMGEAVVEAAGRRIPASRNWVEVNGLSPDTEYPYRVLLDGKLAGEGVVRTESERATRLAFFVMGDYGTGSEPQYQLADVMRREFEKRRRSANPVRFVLTTGDNIYSDLVLGIFPTSTGSRDEDWARKFFQPYEALLRSIPFYPTLGNHDAGKDLPTYLDNFFFPSAEPARFYHFSYGGLADFFALDTTEIQDRSSEKTLPRQGKQYLWLEQALASSKAPWKIAYFHHPPFNAGPGHAASLRPLQAVVELFARSGVQVVFSGHEHNFQLSKQNGATGGVLYVVTGAGGQLRPADVRGGMDSANIAASSGQRHFLLVEIEDQTMRITPISVDPMRVRNRAGQAIPLPIVLPSSNNRTR